jgi:hypothetical protein
MVSQQDQTELRAVTTIRRIPLALEDRRVEGAQLRSVLADTLAAGAKVSDGGLTRIERVRR